MAKRGLNFFVEKILGVNWGCLEIATSIFSANFEVNLNFES